MVAREELEGQARSAVFFIWMENQTMARRHGYTEEKILAVFWQPEDGMTVGDVCRQGRVSE
jgi:hypothetical protein